MPFIILLAISALGVSAVAGYFSIVGLMAIFPAAAYSIAAMGVVLEVAKLVTASWLYRNWETANLLIKLYFVPAVIVLSIITSMGIFGFLSKAHIDQGIESGDATAKIERIDTRIASNDKEIQRAQTTLDNFDATLDRYTELGYVTRGLDARNEQKEERTAMRAIIDAAEDANDLLYDTRSELQSEVRAFEVEVGPIKYIADLIYDNGRENLEAAVRAVIIAIVLVFDPLTILLVVAANMQYMAHTGGRIEFLSLSDDATEAEMMVEPEPEASSMRDEIMDEDKALLTKVANGVSLNPAERKKLKNLDWLVDRKS